jgi:hypothetical protein
LLNLDSVSPGEINQLVADKVREGRNLDYKRELPTGGNDPKKEFLADVTSFANGSGGTIVFGVTETKDASGKNTGIPDAVVGLQVNFDAEILRLEQWLQTGVEPRLPGHRFHVVETGSNCKVIVLVVRQSWLAPHMVATSDSRFYSRTSAGKYSLDVAEIRTAFLRSEASGERVRRFRDGRLSSIASADTPVPLSDGARLVLHIVPLASLERQPGPDLANWSKRSPVAIDGTSMGGHFNADGYVDYAGTEVAGRRAYVQLFREGSLESVEVIDRRGAVPTFPLPWADGAILEAVAIYLKHLREVGAGEPATILVSLIGMRGYGPPASPMRDIRTQPIVLRDVVTLPDVLVTDANAVLPDAMRPILDALWQTFGLPSSLIYRPDGSRDPNFRW